MNAASLLRIAGLYHGLLGLVLVLQPSSFYGATGLPVQSEYLFAGLVGAVLLAAAFCCETARRHPELQAGVSLTLMVGSLVAAVLGLFWVVWADLPIVLMGSVCASGLWAYLFWGLYSPEDTGS